MPRLGGGQRQVEATQELTSRMPKDLDKPQTLSALAGLDGFQVSRGLCFGSPGTGQRPHGAMVYELSYMYEKAYSQVSAYQSDGNPDDQKAKDIKFLS